jgi:hypothetical protein
MVAMVELAVVAVVLLVTELHLALAAQVVLVF